MALDTTDLLTVVGKYVKAINTWNGYLTALESAKGEIFTVLEAEDLEDLYVDLPSQFQGFQSAVSSWISSLISEVGDLLTDEEYVLEQLPIYTTSVTDVLNAIYDQMVVESDTIKSSVVSIGGSDSDVGNFEIKGTVTTASLSRARVFVTRTLDGINPPSSLVSAHTRYNNVEGQLSKSCTLYGKCIASSEDSETIQLFSDSPFEASYTGDAESPGVGPQIVNAQASNLITTNPGFSLWSGDNPTGWTIAPGVSGTDWEDFSGTGAGPLQINTLGTTAKQQLTGLTRRQMYFVGAFCKTVGSPGETGNVKLRIENSDGSTVHKALETKTIEVGLSTGAPDDNYVFSYGFYSPSDTVNLSDIYYCFEWDSDNTGDCDGAQLRAAVVAPVTYYNGLGCAFWNPQDPDVVSTNNYLRNPVLVDDVGSIAIANNNGGVFQTFFRKAFNIQLPTADSPTIADSLAT